MPDRKPSPFDDGQALSERVVTGLSKIALALKTQAWAEAGERGLTPTQGQIVALLLARPEGARLSDLARSLGITAATASDAVSALEAKGLVRKRRSADDARALSIALTAPGRREAQRAASWPDFLLEGVDALAAEEQEVFLRGLMKMIRSLQEKGRIPVQRMCVSCRYFRPNVHADARRPHHCAFVDAPFGDGQLRLDCTEHQPAEPPDAAESWRAFVERRADSPQARRATERTKR